MSKTVLDVGQCGFDGPRMIKMLQTKIGVNVASADTLDAATAMLAKSGYDLVLVNRSLAFEGTAGLELIKRMKKAGDHTPVMLVSDKPDAQREAEACGAIHGLGKSELHAPQTAELIRHALNLS